MRPVPAGPCLSLIHGFEGSQGAPEFTRNQDPGGLWEIGWSHKLSGPNDPLWDVTMTMASSDELAMRDLESAATEVSTLHNVDSLTEGQYGALIDLAYNIGVANFAHSTLKKLVAIGAFHLVPDEFLKWDKEHINGALVVSRGLLRRRRAEVTVWLT